jgi:ATP-binding cassette subfamily B protein
VASDNPERTRRDLRPLAAILRFARPYRLQIAGALVSLLLAAGTVLALGSGLRVLVDQGVSAGDPHVLDRALLVLLAVVVVLAGATFGRFYLVSWIGERVVADIRRVLFDSLVRLSPGFFETMRSGEISSRITADTTLIQTVVGSSASMALRNVILLIGGLGMLAITSPKLTGLVLGVVPLVLIPILVFGRRVRSLSKVSQDRVAELGGQVGEVLDGVRTVQAFGRERWEGERFGGQVEGAFSAAVRRIRARAWLTAAVIVLSLGAVGVVLWIGGHDVLAGRISAGSLSAFVFYAVVVAGALGAISEVVGDLQRAAGAAERLLDLMAEVPEIAAPADPLPLPVPATGAVRFENVSFAYPSAPDRLVLADFTLDVRPGETVALVGPSGAGKSTVFQLLLRLHDPRTGRVMLDGVDLRAADPAEVRARMALVPQDPVVFAADAADNIRYGRDGADDATVKSAAATAAAADFIEALPNGYATFLGARGIRLSGGQRQRLAIARAVLRDPPLLLLDEATSALDAENERMVQEALARVARGRTTIVIAHRLATVLSADRIIVMDQGKVVASGTHAELVAAGGLYARLAELQFAGA